MLWLSFPFTWFVENVLFKRVAVLDPFDNWLNRTFVAWVSALVAMAVISLVTAPPRPEQLAGPANGL